MATGKKIKRKKDNVYFRLSKEERAELEEAQAKANITSTSDYIRHIVLTHIRHGSCSMAGET